MMTNTQTFPRLRNRPQLPRSCLPAKLRNVLLNMNQMIRSSQTTSLPLQVVMGRGYVPFRVQYSTFTLSNILITANHNFSSPHKRFQQLRGSQSPPSCQRWLFYHRV